MVLNLLLDDLLALLVLGTRSFVLCGDTLFALKVLSGGLHIFELGQVLEGSHEALERAKVSKHSQSKHHCFHGDVVAEVVL